MALVLVVARAASAMVRPVGRGVASADATQLRLVQVPAVATSRAEARLAASRSAPPRPLVGLRITGHRDRWEDRPPVLQVRARLAPAL